MRNGVAALLLVLIAWCATAGLVRAAAPLPRDVVVTDVTPGAFTVTWTAEPGTGTVTVFADVLGTAPAPAVIESGPLLGGEAAAAAALGVYRVRVSGLPPRRPFFFRTLTTPLAGGVPLPYPAVGKPLPSAVTGRERRAQSANGVGASVARSGPGTPVPGALVRVTVAGATVPLTSLTGDGYGGALGAIDLANLQAPNGDGLAVVGGESAVVEAVAGTQGRAKLLVSLAANGGFGALQRLALAVAPVADTDGDGIPNDWETEHGLNPNAAADAASDTDGDGLSALAEYRLGTGPGVADTDGDGLTDGAEVNVRGTIPTIADTDRDGRPDGAEVTGIPPSNPLDADTDDDGVDDGTEVNAGTDPGNPTQYPILDADGDGVPDATDKCPTVADPQQKNTDGDGAGDACDPDDDGDGVPDGADACRLVADPAQVDTDGDGIGNACDNCSALASADLTNTDGDALGDVCDPDDDNDGVADLKPPTASNLPFVFVGATAIVDTSLPAVAASDAYIGIAKFLPGDLRVVSIGYFDLKNRTFLPGPPLDPNDASKPGWLTVQVDNNDCDCFTLAGTETITVATNAGNITVVLPLGAETLGRVIFVSADGSTWNATNIPQGILSTLLRSSQQPAPLDNCRLVPNPNQSDLDGDGIGDACDPSTVTTTTTPGSTTTSTTRVRPSTTTTTLPPGKSLFLFVGNNVSGGNTDSQQSLMRFDALTGAPRGVAGGDPGSAVLVPRTRPGSSTQDLGNLAGGARNDVYGTRALNLIRWDASSGANLGVNGNPLSAYLPLTSIQAIDAALGPDGLLWVVDFNSQRIVRVHPETGTQVSTFVQYGGGTPDSVSSIHLTPEGILYVARYRGYDSSALGEVLRYDAATGAPLPGPGKSGASFVASGGFKYAVDFTVGPDGDLYVADYNAQEIRAFDGATGAPRGVFVGSNPASNGGMRKPYGIAFGPAGHLYVASSGSGAVLRYDGFTGAFLDTFIPKGQGGLLEPHALLFYAADTPPPSTTTTSTPPSSTSSTVTTTTVTTSTTTSTTLPLCGNGALDDGEACDGALGACAAGSACGTPASVGRCLCVATAARTLLVNSQLGDADATPGNGVCETAAGNGVCTLRAAVEEANALAGPDLIRLPAGRHPVPLGTFSNPGLIATGDLVVTGAGAATTFVDGGGLTRLFTVQAGVAVTLRDLTLAEGKPTGSQYENVGGVLNKGTLTVVDVVVRDMHGIGECGGIRNMAGATLTMLRTEVVFNRLAGVGFGAAGVSNSGAATIRDSFLHHNVGPTISTFGTGATLRVERSTIWRNRGDVMTTGAGGILHDVNTTTTVIGSTISENIGAGLRGSGNVQVVGSTIYANRAYPSGGGIVVPGPYGVTRVRNSIVAGNDSFAFDKDCAAFGTAFTSEGYNLIQQPTCEIAGDKTGNVTGQAALLGPLVRQGGRTPTHALLAGSPARNAGNPAAPGSGGTACEAADQRGIGRAGGGRCDIGAFEDNGAPPPPPLATLHFVVQDTSTGRDAMLGDRVCATATGTCTLPAAIEEANMHLEPAIVHLPAATFTFTAGPYDDPFEGANALPQVLGDLTLLGQGADATILTLAQPGGGRFRLLLGFSGRLAFERLTLQGGAPSGQTGQSARVIGGRLELRDAVVRDVTSTAYALAVDSGIAVLRRVVLSGNASRGAALGVGYGDVDIEDLVAVGNRNTFDYEGGAVFVLGIGSSRVVRSTFMCNTASVGAAVSFRGRSGTLGASASLLVDDSTFESNVGNAVFSPEPASVEIRRSRFIGNQSDTDGTALVSGGPLLVSDSTFAANTAVGGGGAMYIRGTGSRRIVDSTFTCNRANGRGGAIETDGGAGEVAIERCTFAGNLTYFDSGGALAVGGSGVEGRVTNSSFTDNTAALDGGAIHVNGSTLKVASATVSRNVASRSGGGIAGGAYWLRNTLLAGNRDRGQAPDCATQVQTYGDNLLGTTRGCSIYTPQGVPGPAAGDRFGPATGPPLDARVAPADFVCPVLPLGSCSHVDPGTLPENVCALAPDSPAVEAGNAGGCRDFDGALIPTDSRGVTRTDENHDGVARCEIGACEGTDGVIPPTTTTSSTTTTTFPVVPTPTVPPLESTTTLVGQSTTTTLPPSTTSTTLPPSTTTSSTSTTSSTTTTTTTSTSTTSGSATTTVTTTTHTTSTVTVTSTSVTVTTLPSQTCDGPAAPTYESIDCRLDELIAIVQASNALGRTKPELLRLAMKARDRKIASERLFYANGPRRKTTNLLHKASRMMVSFNYRVRSLGGKQQIDAETSAVLRGLGEPILVDMRTLLKTLRQK